MEPVESTIPIPRPTATSTPGYHLAAMRNSSGPIPMRGFDEDQDKTLLSEQPAQILQPKAQSQIELTEAESKTTI